MRGGFLGFEMFLLVWFDLVWGPDMKYYSDMKNMNRMWLSCHVLILFTLGLGSTPTGLQVILGVRS